MVEDAENSWKGQNHDGDQIHSQRKPGLDRVYPPICLDVVVQLTIILLDEVLLSLEGTNGWGSGKGLSHEAEKWALCHTLYPGCLSEGLNRPIVELDHQIDQELNEQEDSRNYNSSHDYDRDWLVYHCKETIYWPKDLLFEDIKIFGKSVEDSTDRRHIEIQVDRRIQNLVQNLAMNLSCCIPTRHHQDEASQESKEWV